MDIIVYKKRNINLPKINGMSPSKSLFNNIFRGIKSNLNHRFEKNRKLLKVNWILTKYLKHLPANKMHSHQLLAHKTYFYDGPGYLHGLNEIFAEEIYKVDLPQEPFIIDCGSHIGLSVIYFKHIYPGANILCFEPDPLNFQLLKKNIGSHQLTNINPIEKAVWTEDTTLNFSQKGNMESRISPENSTGNNKVKTARLKDYLNGQVDFLKLDIEGAEYSVLMDIQENLHFVSKMFIEYHGSFSQNNELVKIFEILTRSGFSFYIKEAANLYSHPFIKRVHHSDFDLQLNIFSFKN